MSEQVTHIDVGYTRGVAHLLGIQPTTLILCGAKDGNTIRDDRTAIRGVGNYPAACNCAACKEIATIMHREDMQPAQARATYNQRKA